MKLLAICHDIEPLETPQAIQIGRLLAHLADCDILLASGGGEDGPAATAIRGLRGHLRQPGHQGRETPLARLARLTLPLVGKTPDGLERWRAALLERLGPWLDGLPVKPDVIASFGEPMSGHLVALEAKRRLGLPWLAHFSDPWADNPFRRGGPLTRAANRRLERRVIKNADLVVFTSQETAELVGARYTARETAKFRVLPHGFDPRLYPPTPAIEGPIIVRHIGSFYGARTPFPLIEALRLLAAADADIARRMTVELVGPMPERMARRVREAALPEGLLRLAAPVSYASSLALMVASDLLLLIDAPARRSVFLASKLIDYVGAGREVMAITPEGAGRTVVERFGGTAAHPQDPAVIARALSRVVSGCEARRDSAPRVWGDPAVRANYEAGPVAALLRGYLTEAIRHASTD
jgi:hypothetical protein